MEQQESSFPDELSLEKGKNAGNQTLPGPHCLKCLSLLAPKCSKNKFNHFKNLYMHLALGGIKITDCNLSFLCITKYWKRSYVTFTSPCLSAHNLTMHFPNELDFPMLLESNGILGELILYILSSCSLSCRLICAKCTVHSLGGIEFCTSESLMLCVLNVQHSMY